MTTVTGLYKYLNEKIPSSLSLDWDNDGLMCCPEPDREVKKILCTLDVTPGTVDYAAEHNFDVIISHHPVIFSPVSALVSPKLIKLIKCGIAVMSFHTRLDIIAGGINDLLAAMLDLRDTVPFADGAGRIGTLASPVEFTIFCGNLKNTLGADRINAVKATQTVHKVAVVSGSGGEFIGDAAALGADTFISGECGYHRLLDAKEAGINSFETGHFFSERHAAGYLKELISERYSGITAEIYEKNEIQII